MAAKTPNSISERVVQGSRSQFTLYFTTTFIDDGDTIDLSPYLSSVEDASWQGAGNLVPAAMEFTLSGAGNVTATALTDGDSQAGRLVIQGTP
jgi:hypothetical protein